MLVWKFGILLLFKVFDGTLLTPLSEPLTFQAIFIFGKDHNNGNADRIKIWSKSLRRQFREEYPWEVRIPTRKSLARFAKIYKMVQD